MDWVKIHLAVNHISVIGMPFLMLLLAWGWLRRLEPVARLAIWWIALFSLLSILLKFTGDFAAEQKGAQLDPALNYVTRHEQAADQATTLIFLTGVAAVACLIASRRGKSAPAWSLAAVLVFGVATCVLLARAANLGGKIGHPELR